MELIDLAFTLLGGALALGGLSAWKRRPRKAEPLKWEPGSDVSITYTHEHDWHIGGKDNGVIRRECACGEVMHG